MGVSISMILKGKTDDGHNAPDLRLGSSGTGDTI
jgi:hypothetical protein